MQFFSARNVTHMAHPHAQDEAPEALHKPILASLGVGLPNLRLHALEKVELRCWSVEGVSWNDAEQVEAFSSRVARPLSHLHACDRGRCPPILRHRY